LLTVVRDVDVLFQDVQSVISMISDTALLIDSRKSGFSLLDVVKIAID